jgi:hypothetical protein
VKITSLPHTWRTNDKDFKSLGVDEKKAQDLICSF